MVLDTSKPRDSWLRSLISSTSKLLARSRVTHSGLSSNVNRGSLDVTQAERTDAVVETALPMADDGTVVPGPTAYPWIPLENQQYIIGFLAPGSRGALTAALVCRSWYPAAMAVLYYSFTFPHALKPYLSMPCHYVPLSTVALWHSSPLPHCSLPIWLFLLSIPTRLRPHHDLSGRLADS